MRRWAWPFTFGLLLALVVITITVSVLVWTVRGDVLDITEGRKTTEVATCYGSARGRPGLIVILRVLSGAATTTAERAIVDGFIDAYEDNTPTVEECDTLAKLRDLDPEDFPAPAIPTQREQEREDGTE